MTALSDTVEVADRGQLTLICSNGEEDEKCIVCEHRCRKKCVESQIVRMIREESMKRKL